MQVEPIVRRVSGKRKGTRAKAPRDRRVGGPIAMDGTPPAGPATTAAANGMKKVAIRRRRPGSGDAATHHRSVVL
jgi:hypothetical protein